MANKNSEKITGVFVDALTGEIVERELTSKEIADLQQQQSPIPNNK